jgi:hypothetical protein
MTIFDVIRYPVSDIYNENELNLLPEDLYREWFIRCNGVVSNKDYDRVNQIKIAVTIQAINSAKANSFSKSHTGFEELWKAIFTKMLKEVIKEYDSH